MPSKALLRPADVLAEARRIPGVPVGADGELDPQAILDRRDEVIHDLDDSGQLPWLEERGIDLYRGAGRFDGERRLRRRRRRPDRRARPSIVATGSGAAMPPIDGLDAVEAWNNRQATTAKQVPESMIVLGGGPVGSELSQAWASLGTKVTLVEGDEHLLAREEPFAGEEVAAALRERFGVDVRTGAQAEQVERRRRRVVIASSSDGGRVEGGARSWSRSAACPTPPSSASTRSGSSPTSTASSRPTTGCGSAAASGSTRSATSTAAPSSPTSASTRPGSRPRTCSAARSRRSPKAIGSPRVTFTDPQVAAVGKTLAQAREAGIDARRGRRPHRRLRRRQLPGQGHRRHLAPRRRPGARDDRRRHLHRLRDRRLPPGGDGRDRRRGAAAAPAPRDRRLPHPQRDLAEAAREVRSRRLSRRRQTVERLFRSRAGPAGSRRPGRGRRPTGSRRGARGGRAGGSPG